jgi:hypothetical protein
LKTFFLSQKKFSNFQKNALGADKTVGLCPTPHPLFEKSGAKTFMGGYAAGEFWGCDACSRKALAFRI